MMGLTLSHWLLVLLIIGVVVGFIRLLRLLTSHTKNQNVQTTEARLQELTSLRSKGLVSD